MNIQPVINIDKQILKDNHIIIIIWLVKAIPKGIRLNKLQINTKLNKVKINGKNKYPSLPICCLIKLKINSTTISNKYCKDVGIKLKLCFKNIMIIQAKKINKVIGSKMLKNDKSKSKILIEINRIASNCSNGENINLF